MTASAVHKLSVFSDPCIAKELVFEAPWYCLTRIYNPGTSTLALICLCSWLNARICVGSCAAEAVINRASELWKSSKSRK